jgi:hypothetical protein
MELQTIQAENGGRPAANDDFLALQSQPLALGLPALLLDMPPCIVSGCKAYKTGSLWNVGAGMVWDGATLLPFPGQFNVTLPAMFQPGAVQVLDQRAYQTGGTKNTILGQSMELVAVVAGAPNLVIDTYGALTFWHRVQEKTRSAKQVEWVAAVALANYTSDGVGRPGTEAWGWALVDGQGGRVDLLGRAAVALDPNRTDYDTIGKQGGAETVSLTADQNGQHNHVPAGQFAFNRALALANYGENTTVKDPDGSGNGNGGEPGLTKTGAIEPSGSGTPHENRMPFTTLLARVWVGY